MPTTGISICYNSKSCRVQHVANHAAAVSIHHNSYGDRGSNLRCCRRSDTLDHLCTVFTLLLTLSAKCGESGLEGGRTTISTTSITSVTITTSIAITITVTITQSDNASSRHPHSCSFPTATIGHTAIFRSGHHMIRSPET